jgi:hypothetical protein
LKNRTELPTSPGRDGVIQHQSSVAADQKVHYSPISAKESGHNDVVDLCSCSSGSIWGPGGNSPLRWKRDVCVKISTHANVMMGG